jgi:hypothetical protein
MEEMQAQESSSNGCNKAVSARICAYEQYGGGGILRFELASNGTVQYVLQAELLFDFRDHMKHYAETFAKHIASADYAFRETDARSREGFNGDHAYMVKGGWSLNVDGEFLVWNPVLVEEGEAPISLTPMPAATHGKRWNRHRFTDTPSPPAV